MDDEELDDKVNREFKELSESKELADYTELPDEPSKSPFFLDRYRYLTFVIILLIMWITIIGFFYLKADEVTNDPCTVCAMKIGTAVQCRIISTDRYISRDYESNGTVSQTSKMQEELINNSTLPLIMAKC